MEGRDDREGMERLGDRLATNAVGGPNAYQHNPAPRQTAPVRDSRLKISTGRPTDAPAAVRAPDGLLARWSGRQCATLPASAAMMRFDESEHERLKRITEELEREHAALHDQPIMGEWRRGPPRQAP